MQHHAHHKAVRATSLIAVAGLALLGTLVAPSAQGAPALASKPAAGAKDNSGKSDNLAGPFSAKQNAMRQAALAKRLKGDPSAQGDIVKLGKGQYVNLGNERTDRVFVILAEFGDTRHAAYPDGVSDAVRFDGPLHNQIPAPDRSVDNSTLWQADYNKAHFENMYFTRMAKYFQTQSTGRYSVAGSVVDWVKVPFNQARYGRDFCGGIVCNNTWFLLRDAMSVWVKGQLEAGQTMAQIQAYLKTFDIQDRYDADGDGNFDEPDGFIDHFQIVHAGGDQAAGDPTYGTDAIWSHRWYAQLSAGGPGGMPGFNIGQGGTSSGVVLANNPTGVWVGDYTIQPENGGLGVFAHEYTHDLGLPDLYDTSGNTGGAENSTAFWTLMSSGANIGNGGVDGIGDSPTDLSAWELLQLGWLAKQGSVGPFYDVAHAGKRSSHELASNVPGTKKAQAVFVVLPDKTVELNLGAPYEGSTFYYSGSGDDLNVTMTKSGVTGTALTAQVHHAIEEDWDYAFLEASTDGTTWLPVPTNLSDTAGDQSGFNASGTGLTGTRSAWTALTATLPAGTTAIRFRYQTDGAVAEAGFSVDAIAIGGTPVDTGWVFDGFRETTGLEQQYFFNAYVAENRQYDGYDASLKTAYNFGFLTTTPDWVETYPYQNGLLVWYWDESQSDNNVGDHPGHGLLLPVDAHPQLATWSDGQLARPRIAAYDSTFGLEATDPITLHKSGDVLSIGSAPAVPVFDDTKSWWVGGTAPGRYQPGWYSVDVPKTGTTIRVVSTSKQGNQLNLVVAPK